MKTYRKLSKPTQRDRAKSNQVKNSAGGYVFKIDDMARLRRFLILGSDVPTYYASARKLTLQNVGIVQHCWEKHPSETASLIKEVSVGGLAPRVDPVLFALALGASHDNEEARTLALLLLSDICRTASHLFSFLSAVTEMRGWGRKLKNAVARWYTAKPLDDLAYQLMKYRQREGFTHQRAIELSHPRVHDDEALGVVLRWARGKGVDSTLLPHRLQAFLRVMNPETSAKDVRELITQYNLPWEAVPTEYRKDKQVMSRLLMGMPLGARLRQLGLMTSLGILTKDHVQPFLNGGRLKGARIHPFHVLLALKIYEQGHGERSSWDPKNFVIEMLNDAFYIAFKAIEPSNKRIMIGLDVSASMDWQSSCVMNSPLTAREASAAMCMATLKAEDEVAILAFSDRLTPTKIHRRMSLEEVTGYVRGLPAGRTDCALPMRFAEHHEIPVDAFVIYTDNETWYGDVHPYQALLSYRRKMKVDARLVVVGMTATGFSIADPSDPGMLDVVGFDASAPAMISNFIAGRV